MISPHQQVGLWGWTDGGGAAVFRSSIQMKRSRMRTAAALLLLWLAPVLKTLFR